MFFSRIVPEPDCDLRTNEEVGSMPAHDSSVWTLSWHPLGHILTSGSNDHTTKFWTRNRPGDNMRDRYNLGVDPNAVPVGTAEEEADDGRKIQLSYTLKTD